MSRWTRPPLDKDSSRLLSSIEEGLTVELIATFEPRACEIGDDLQDVIVREDLQQFDYIPVKDGKCTVGLLHRTVPENSGPKAVNEVMDPLHEGILISSDTGILSYIERAMEHPCHLVLHDNQLDGIVTLSDLQKLPVRPALFLLVTHVELLMAEWIGGSGLDEEKIVVRLPEDRKAKVQQKWNRLRSNNLAVDPITATEFFDKRELILDLGFVSGKGPKAEARKDLDDIEQLLRNPLAHAGDFAFDEERARKTAQTVRTARSWIERLEKAIRKQTSQAELRKGEPWK